MDPANDHLLAIMAVDPGGTTGVALAVIERPRKVAGVMSPASVWDALREADIESYDVKGIPARQAWEIMEGYKEWREPYRYFEIVFEDFVVQLQRGQRVMTRDLLDPVRVSEACEALSYTRKGMRWAHILYQMPADKGFATNDRLRRHGLWERGVSDHRRDAVRHVAARYADVLTKGRK